MNKNTISNITAILVIVLVGCVSHTAMALEVTTINGPWLEEQEFLSDESLHATLDQVIIFDLEPTAPSDRPQKWHKKNHGEYHYDDYRDREKDYGKYEKRYKKDKERYYSKHTGNHGKYRKPKRHHGHNQLKLNTARFLIPEATDVSFCIAEDDQYIEALKLETADGDQLLWSMPGDDCLVLELEANSYLLHVLHDPQNISGVSKKVFFHHPQQARLLGNVDSNFVVPNLMAFKGPNGGFVTGELNDDGSAHPVWAGDTTVGANQVWQLRTSTTYPLFFFFNANQKPIRYGLIENLFYIGTTRSTDSPSSFKITDEGDGRFHLNLFSSDGQDIFKPVFEWDDGLFSIVAHGADQAIFSVDYKQFNCTTCDSSTLQLQQGEAALFAECNYKGPAYVFGADVPDLSIYDEAAAFGTGVAMGDNMAASIRLGPNTFGILYPDSQFGGTATDIVTDTLCLDSTNLGTKALSSFKVFTDIKQYIIASHTCENCDLKGVNLSGLDFTAAQFTGSDFSGATLTNTIFRSAHLDHATFSGKDKKLDGTDFSNAILYCTDLSDSDLSTAIFGDNPIITKDFSCRLNLSGSTLPITALPYASWRYIDFTGATLLNGAGTTISTLENPVDLSGSRLSKVTGLSGVILDGGKMGCATPVETDKRCTQMIDTDLSNSSLVHTHLSDAAMNGANLNYTNLEMADLSGADLAKSPNTSLSTTLEGAYLKNANLARADLSGATLKNVNWYNSDPCSNGPCADGKEAILSNAVLTGAYLNGLDLSNAILHGADLSGAMLVGVNFTGAHLSRDPTIGKRTSLSGAFLQGANFTDAITTGVDFTNAYVDLASASGGIMVFQMPRNNLNFVGYWKDPNEPECVLFNYSKPTTVPVTNNTNICPDGGNGECTGRWQSPSTPIAEAQPHSTSGLPPPFPGKCTETDRNWSK